MNNLACGRSIDQTAASPQSSDDTPGAHTREMSRLHLRSRILDCRSRVPLGAETRRTSQIFYFEYCHSQGLMLIPEDHGGDLEFLG